MKTFSLMAAVLALGLTLGIADAEAAKRFGGGQSSGMQRQAISPDRAPTPAAPPVAAPGAAKGQAAAAPAATPKRSWMGPLAGLAAGLGLAALASHFGFGEELASMLMFGLLAMVVMMVIGFFLRRRANANAPAISQPGGLRYAAAAADQAPMSRNTADLSMPAGAVAGASATQARIPADFDAVGFVRNAKVNFIRLQAANDAGNLDDIRAFTTPEMFAEIRMNIAERGNAAQTTDVVSIEAEVLDVTEEASRYIVSVRFTGLIREDQDAAAESVDEIWHMVKPRDGTGGWVVAGIQQMH